MSKNPFADPNFGAPSTPNLAADNPFADPNFGKEQSRGVKGVAQDVAATAVKAALAVPEVAVGVADLVTGGKAGKALEGVGVRFKEAREIAEGWHSDVTKAQKAEFQNADGVAGKAAVALSNPSLIAMAVGESLGAMGAGGAIGRGAMAATRLGQMGAKGAAIAGAAGEGVVGAGSAAEQIRQETADGELTAKQATLAAGTGLATGALGFAGNKVANRLGIGDADMMLAQGTRGMAKDAAERATAAAVNPLSQPAQKSILRQMGEGAITEGVLEELPQSVSEQILQNEALGKSWSEGLDDAIVMGILSGGAMGAGAAGYRGFKDKQIDDAAANARSAAANAPGATPGQDQAAGAVQPAAWTTSAGAAAEVEPGTAQASLANAPNLDYETLPGAAPEAQGNEIDFTRDFPAPEWGTELGADGQQPAATAAPELTPSQAMGLDPNAGALSKAAAMAVDSGASPVAQPQVAPVAEQQTAPQVPAGVDPDTGEVSLQAQMDELKSRIAFMQQQGAAQGWDGNRAAQRNALQTQLTRLELQAAGGQERGASTTGAPAPVQLTGINQILAKQIPDMNEQELQQAISHYGPTHKRTKKLEKALQAFAQKTLTAIESGANANVSEADQAQQGRTQPAQTGAAQAGQDAGEGVGNGTTPAANPGTQEQSASLAKAQAQVSEAAGAAQAAVGKAAQIAREGNAEREAQRQRQLDASERWTRMTTVERQAVAATAPGLNAIARKNVHTRAWPDLGEKIREKLLDSLVEPLVAPASKVPEDTESVANVAPAAVSGDALPKPAAQPVGDEKPFAAETGTLGIPRAEMPQVPTANHGGLVKHLNAQGIAHETTTVDAAQLKPTQAEYSPSKVEAAKSATGDRAVIVSSDGHIIDGHHQAVAAAEEGKQVKAIVLDAPVEQALAAVKASPSANTEAVVAPQSAPKSVPERMKEAKAAKDAASAAAPAPAAKPKSVPERMREAAAARAAKPAFRREAADAATGADFDVASFLQIMDEGQTAGTASAAAPTTNVRPSYSPAARAEAVRAVKGTADAIRQAWANGPEVIVAFDMQDAAVPESACRADLKQRSGGARGAPEGFYYQGKVYLMASKLKTPNDAARVLFHEALGHHGLRGLFGKDLGLILNQVATMRKAEVDAKIEEYGLRRVNRLDRRTAAEEVLAEMAQNTPQIGFVRRAVAAIRTWLRTHVPGFKSLALTDAELIRNFILPARAWVERGGPDSVVMPQITGFSRSPMKSVDANVERGRQALAKAMNDRTTVHRAMFRNGLGWVDFVWGSEGIIKASGRTKGGMGLSHILEARQRKDALSESEAVQFLDEVVVAIAQGREFQRAEYAPATRVGVEHENTVVWLTKRQGGNAWVVTGYEKVPSGTAAGRATTEPTHQAASLTRDKMEGTEGIVDESGDDGNVVFSRSRFADLKDSALDQLTKTFTHEGKVSLWDKSVGTMRHLAERAPSFKPVYESAQQNIDDVSMLANDAADMAPRILPRVESLGDLKKKPVSAADNKAVARPLFEGTLIWARDENGKPTLVDDLQKRYANLSAHNKAAMLLKHGKIKSEVLAMWQGLPVAQFEKLINSRLENKMLKPGIVWSDAELQAQFGTDANQISLYREARAAIDRSIDMTARTDMLRVVGEKYEPMRDAVLAQPSVEAAAQLLLDTLEQDAKADPDSRERLAGYMQLINRRLDTAVDLQKGGYAPLSRFGRYTVDVVDANGERLYFGMYETARDSNRAKMQLAQEFKGATVTTGTMSAEAYKLFAGVTPETLEQFGEMLGLKSEGNEAQDKAFQEFLKLTKNNHSAMKRLIHRKGIAGFSEDVGRVVANFVYSNARAGAMGLNAGKMETAIGKIPKEQGELKDLAMGLRDYIRDPQEEGQAVRGMLFAQYLGGSIASAFVNTTQPFAVTLPWLSQYGGMKKAGAQLARALKDMGRSVADKGFQYEADLAKALQSAEDDGVVSPQEIHQLMAQARGAGMLRSGDGSKAGDLRAKAGNLWEQGKVLWGQPFALAEQFNRRSTFIASYRIAKDQGMADPAEFARKAVKETQFVYCVDSETECLTLKGWKRRDELIEGDVVLGVDEFGQAVETPLLAVHRFPGRRVVTQFSNSNRFSMMVTDGHRHVVQNYNSRDKVWQKPLIRTTAELREGHHLMRVPVISISRDGGDADFAALLGWIAAEGNYARFRNCKEKRNVRIAQSAAHNPDYVAEIERLLVALGGHYRRFNHPKNHGMVTFTLKKPLSTRVLEAMPEKLLTWQMVGELSALEMRALLDAFAKGDGHKLKEGGWTIGQKQEQNLHVLQAMSVLCGQNATLYPASDRENGKVAHLYLHTQGARTMVKQLTRTAVEVQDGVWCPETGTGTWIARRNGAVFVTGNSKANKPKWARGAVGGTLFTFKTYSVSYLELMQRMWNQGGPEGKRAVGWALAMLLLMSGAGGVPFMEDAEDLIDGAGQMMGYNISSKQWRKELLANVVGKELGEFMEQGLSGLPGAPIDVSGRLGMGNLLPGTGLFLEKPNRERDMTEIIGPAGDLVARGFSGARQVAKGVANWDASAVGRGVLEWAPTAVRNLAKGADMAATGMYRDTKGYKVIDTTLAEAAAKAIGFQPKSVAEVQEANSFMQRSKSFYTQTSSDIKAQWADALFRKDEAAVQRVRERLADWNLDNPEQPIVVKMPDVWKRVREMGKDRSDRIAATAPKALREQMRQMMSIL